MAEDQLDTREMRQLVNSSYPPSARRRLSERFARGASLWLFEIDNDLAAYGWTLRGDTIEPHFFPLGSNDVHLFDFFVFPEYRGRRLNPALVNDILSELAIESRYQGRAFIDAADWNTPQLHSLKRMSFHQLGCARKYELGGGQSFFGARRVPHSDKSKRIRKAADEHNLHSSGKRMLRRSPSDDANG